MSILAAASKKNPITKNSKRNASQSRPQVPSRFLPPEIQMLGLQKTLGNKNLQNILAKSRSSLSIESPISDAEKENISPGINISAGLQEKLDNAGLTFEEVRNISNDIFTVNKNGETILKAVIVNDTVTVDPNSVVKKDVLDRVRARIALNDRGSAYMELYNAIGEEQLLLQAAITTYSGAMGSGALIGNMLSKNMAGDLYNLSLDQFSLDILQGTFDAVEKETLAGKTVGSMDRNFFQDADHAVWASKGMGDYFPGNIQFVDYKNHRDPEAAKKIYETIGTINAAQLGQEFMTLFSDIQGLGSRPADYSDKDGYRTIEGERFITVIDISTGSIEVFWDKNLPVNAEEWPSDIPMDLYSDDLKTFPPYFPVLNIIGELLSGKPIVPTQIENRPRNGWNLEKGNLVRAYVQAGNKHIADYDESLSYKNFGSVDADLLEISEEISEHDISPYFLRNKW